MKKLLLIFIVATGYIKPIVVGLAIMFSSTIAIILGWSYYDIQEVGLRNQVVAQQEITKIVYDTSLQIKTNKMKMMFMREQQKLVDLRAEYDTMRGSWFGYLLLKNRPGLSIKIIISTETRNVFSN